MKKRSYYTAHLATGLGNGVTIEGVTCTTSVMKAGKLVTFPAPGFGMTLINTTH